jgi:3-oxoacyl-[acyl-carrier protein] reductase
MYLYQNAKNTNFNMNLDLTNKTALVCGASQGLGLATAKELALLGATVIIASRTEEKLQKSITQLDTKAGQQHSYIAIDLSKPAEAKAAVEAIVSKGITIHILVNNAGGPAAGPMIDTDAAELEKAFRTHVISSHVLAQLVVPGMKAARYGRIINIVSTSVKQPINGLGISNTVRAAVANWAKTLANEISSYGITINNVLPGYNNTDRLKNLFGKQATDQGTDKQAILNRIVSAIPVQRLGEPEELGAAVAFLCSPAAAYINGINLPVDGGGTGTL